MTIDKAFGKVIRHYRIEQGISQEELGFLADVHRTYISQIERGLKSPTLKVIKTLADALQTDMYKIIRDTEELHKNDT